MKRDYARVSMLVAWLANLVEGRFEVYSETLRREGPGGVIKMLTPRQESSLANCLGA
jgi:hypothetical protein